MNLQDFFIVFLRDHHHPLNEELAVNKHVDLLSTLKGRLVLSLLITSFIMFPFLAALDKGTYFFFLGGTVKLMQEIPWYIAIPEASMHLQQSCLQMKLACYPV